MKLLGADYHCRQVLDLFGGLMVLYCAREGSKQRFVPTGLAAGDNEIKQRRNFSKTHFPGVAPYGFRLDGHDGNIVWDGSRPSVCYPLRG